MGYGEPPWRFTGRAIYQLQLVKSEEARKYVPEELKLVELFGRTLGGFYLARYSDSPVGAFDELVVLGGLVWNAPTSCAWAARVYVNNRDARNHGLRSVGLPSRFAQFKFLDKLEQNATSEKKTTWWSRGQSVTPPDYVQVSNLESTLPLFDRWLGPKTPVCTFVLEEEKKGWKGPNIKMRLPSFSGHTANCPDLLKYALVLKTRVKPIRGLKMVWNDDEQKGDEIPGESMENLLTGRTLLSLSFDDMEMMVDAPEKVKAKPPPSGAPQETSLA